MMGQASTGQSVARSRAGCFHTLNPLRRRVACCAVIAVSLARSALAQDPVPVEVVVPQQIERAATLRLTGTLTAARHASLSAREGGLVTAVMVDAGDRATHGEPLVRLDASLVEIELRRAEAALDEALTRLAEAQRLRDEAHALGANIPQSTLRTREAQVAIEQAALARLDAEKQRQEELVARHEVLAPFDGVVSRKRTEVGEWVTPGEPVLDFVATDQLRLDVQVPQDHFAGILVGGSVRVRLDAFPEKHFVGSVAAKVPVGDASSRTFLVRVVLDNPSGEISAGMSGEVAFDTQHSAGGLVLPRDTLKRYPDGTTTVWIVRDASDGLSAYEREIQIGPRIGATIEVLDGLDADVRVVVRGNETLSEGVAVRIVDTTTMR